MAERRSPFSRVVYRDCHQACATPPPSLREKVSTIPPAVEQVVLKALAKNPKQRFERVQAFAEALEEASKEEASGRTLFVSGSDIPGQHPAESEPTAGQWKARPHNLPAQVTSLIGREEETQVLWTL